MEGIAHGMKPQAGKGPSPAVAREFVQADQAQGKFRGKKKSVKSLGEHFA